MVYPVPPRYPSSPLSSATPSPRSRPRDMDMDMDMDGDRRGSLTPPTPSTVPLDPEDEGSVSGSSELTDDEEEEEDVREEKKEGSDGEGGLVDEGEELGGENHQDMMTVDEEAINGDDREREVEEEEEQEEVEVEEEEEEVEEEEEQEEIEGKEDEPHRADPRRKPIDDDDGDPNIHWTSDTSYSLTPPPSTMYHSKPLPVVEVEDVPTALDRPTRAASPATSNEKGKGKEIVEAVEEVVVEEAAPAEHARDDLAEQENDEEVVPGDVITSEAVEGEVPVDTGRVVEDERTIEEDLPGDPRIEYDQAAPIEADHEEPKEQPEADTPILPHQARLQGHSSHAPPPSQAAVRQSLLLELKFAALRDRLYVERMDEAAREEEMVHNGTHPALKYLYRTLAGRRERLHEVASRRHQETLLELKKAREAEKNHTWTWWTDERDKLHWDEFEQTWSKRRRLAREKNELETPRIVRPIPRAAPIRPMGWQLGATPLKLGMEEAAQDLAAMEKRPMMQLRHPSPSVFVPQAPTQQYSAAASHSNHHTVSNYSHHSIQPTYPQQRQPIASSLLARTISAGTSQVQQSQSSSQTHTHPSYLQQPPTHSQPYQSQSSSHNPPYLQSSSQNQNHMQNQYRREGRTVPTSSDMFEKRRIDSTNTGSGSSDSMLGAWAKHHDHRPSVNGNGNGNSNGNGTAHAHGNGGNNLVNNNHNSDSPPPSHSNRSPPPSLPPLHTLPPVKDNPPTGQMMQNHSTSTQGNRYPGLSDYLSGKGILSPPKTVGGGGGGGIGFLGALGGRSPFSSQGSGQATTAAGTPQQR